MPAVEGVIGKVRAYLGHPRSDAPSDNQILTVMYDHNQLAINSMRLTQEAWLLQKLFLNVTSDRSSFSIADPQFAGAFHVETNPDYYPTTHRRREVPIVNFQDASFVEPRWSIQAQPGASEIDTLSCISFRNVDGLWEAVTFPTGAQGNYIVWYNPGFVLPPSQLNNPQMIAAFHGMLALATAHSLVPFTEWEGMDPVAADRRRDMLQRTLEFDLARNEAVFQRYRFSVNSAEATNRLTFGRNRRAVRRARNPMLRNLNWP